MKIIFILICTVILNQTAVSQNDHTGKWTRVQSDNGEFSIEVPEGFSYFFDSEGFQVSKDRTDYRLRDVAIVNSYSDGTLLSFEIYRGKAGALEALAQSTVPRDFELKKADLNGISAKEIVKTDDKSYFVSRYIRSKEFIYVLSALSRTRDTPEVRRFFESLKFAPGSKTPSPDGRRLSAMVVSPIDIKTRSAATPGPPSTGIGEPATPSAGEKALIIASRPRPSYLDGARATNVQGTIQLRLEFAKNGYIPNVEVLKTLPEGLFRQALFAALRIKFLPAEKNGEPVAVRKVLEYTFAIY